MSTQVQYRRGTNAQNDAFVGALAEITVDTTNKTLRVHDGVTAGGAALAGTTATQTLTNKTYEGTSLSVTGNVTGSFILGNGSQLTGIDATSIQSGTSNVRVVSSGGNVAAGIGGTSNVMVIATTGLFVTGLTSVTGNITGNYILGNGSQLTGIDATSIQFGTSNVRVQSSGGNVSVGVGGSAILRFTTAGIVNDMGNGVGNIGNTTGYFNTIFAKATSAQYADVAEKYVADRVYAPGTVLEIGGPGEVQETTTYASTRIAGVVSTTPALLMNSGESDQNAVELALLGRVPCRVTGTVHRGDLLTSSDRPGVATALKSGDYRPGCVIGKALEAHATAGEGTIEIIVGRL